MKAGYAKIKAAQKENEKWVLQQVKEGMKTGKLYYWTTGLTGIRTHNAIDRLVEAGKIKLVRYGYRKMMIGYKLAK